MTPPGTPLVIGARAGLAGTPAHCSKPAEAQRFGTAPTPGLPVLVLSQYVEQIYARELLADGSGEGSYLLKDRVFDSAEFAEALRRVAGGGTAMDPEVISRLLARNADDGDMGGLSPGSGRCCS